MRSVLDENVEKIKTHVVCSITVFCFESRAVSEIMWKNIGDPGRLQMTIWRMRFACRITKVTDTHSEYVNIIFFHGNSGYANAPRA
jgi:hypothetical protein